MLLNDASTFTIRTDTGTVKMSLYVVFRSYSTKNDPPLMYCFLPFSMYNSAVFRLTWSQLDTSRWQGPVVTVLSRAQHSQAPGNHLW